MNRHIPNRCRKILQLCIYILFAAGTVSAAENTVELQKPQSIFSLDISYLLSGAAKQGAGIGIKYERSLHPYFSVKGGFGHTLFKTETENVCCAGVHVSLSAFVYPFGSGLDKLYIGFGSSCEFLNYFGAAVRQGQEHDSVIFVTPAAGYKLYLFKRLLIDFSVGYNIILTPTTRYGQADFADSAWQFGISFKILKRKT